MNVGVGKQGRVSGSRDRGCASGEAEVWEKLKENGKRVLCVYVCQSVREERNVYYVRKKIRMCVFR